MAEKQTDLTLFDNSWYKPGASLFTRVIWYFTNALFFINPFNPFNSLKTGLLKVFGARIGKGVVIKPGVNIKYPWLLKLGNHVWIGEKVWIDNLEQVTVHDHVCISQGAMLITGSHNYKKTTFDLITLQIELGRGVWIGARAVVCPGVTCHSHSLLTVNSVATSDLEEYGIYQGNPAKYKREREIF